MRPRRRAATLALVTSLVAGTASAVPPPASDALPEAYEGRLVLRVDASLAGVYRTALYETSNLVMRGSKDENGLYEGGSATAERFRALARASAGVFVLRDALFSQPDHPFEQAPFAPMLPPSFVTVAVAECRAGRTVEPVAVPEGEDAGWSALDAGTAFGSFPPSPRLLGEATRPVEGASPGDASRTRNARATLVRLASDTRALAAACAQGPRTVAARGAERIAEADERYFDAALRRTRFVPISVANPNAHEIEDEGKGFVVAGRALEARDVRTARNAVLRRRLAAGPLAIERFDLSKPAERRLALHLLADLVPRGSRGPDVWLWVNGGLDARGIGGRDALPFVPAFLDALARAPVARGRVRLLSKPHVELPSDGARAALDAAVERHRALGMPVSLNLGGRALLRRLGR